MKERYYIRLLRFSKFLFIVAYIYYEVSKKILRETGKQKDIESVKSYIASSSKFLCMSMQLYESSIENRKLAYQVIHCD